MKKALCFMLVLLLLCVMPAAVFAAEVEHQDGLEVSLITDKGTYAAGDDIGLSISVENTNAYAVEGIELDVPVPQGYTMAEMPQPLNLAAGESKTVQLTLSAPAQKSFSPLWLLCGLLIPLVAVVAWLCRKKQPVKALCLLLCLCMVLSMMPVSASASASAEGAALTLDKTVTVDGETLKLELNVRYPVALQNVVPLVSGDLHPVLEELYDVEGTDADDDGDGLDNYTEICVLFTDPKAVDSNLNGINDADEDADEDGLTNANELRNGTNLNKKDTDGDGLTDGEEVLTYHTDPTARDTDGDGLTDGDEIVLGLDPLTAVSDGVTPDAERTFVQTLNQENISERLLDEQSDARPALTVNTTGNINSKAVIRGAQSYRFGDSRALVGEPVALLTSDTGEQKMSFTLSDRINTTFGDGVTNANLICQYQDDGTVTYLDTEFDAATNTVSASVKGEGTYFVMNVPTLLDEMGYSQPVSISGSRVVNQMNKSNAAATAQADIVFVIDTTGSMGDEITAVKDNIDDFVAQLSSNGVSAALGLVTYEDLMVDGEDSTQVHKNGASNWFYDTASFRTKLAALELGVGGDAPECVVDALETARLMGLRGSAGKLFVLVTDAPAKVDNRYGISSLEAQIQLLNNAGITCAVASAGDLQGEYESLYTQTGGLWLDLYGDFHSDLMALAQSVSKSRAGDGAWVYLDGPVPVPVRLNELPYEGSTVDTDGDHIPDIVELNGANPDGTVDLDALIAAVSRGAVTNTDYGIVPVYRANSNPLEVDTDFDGIEDSADSDPANNHFAGILSYDDGKNTANVEFDVDYSLFFESNTVYYHELSQLAVLYASDVYGGCYVEVTEGVQGGTDEATAFGKLFGMTDCEDIHIKASDYAVDKDDLTEFFVGHRTIYRNGEQKELVIMSVRGTNSTNAEWTSNFDVGADNSDYYNAVGTEHPHWLDKENHKGFDVTTNRVLERFAEYEKRHGLDKLENKVILITGHSRGAGISNLLGAHFEDRPDYKSYTYTFAAPYATTHSNAGTYRTVFNVVNSDDLIPYLPMPEWGFYKYGVTHTLSVNDLYEDDNWFDDKEGSFEWLCGYDYNDNGGIAGALDAFNKLATCREELYVLDPTSDGKVNIGNASHFSQEAAEKRKAEVEALLEELKLNRFVSVGVRKSGLMWIAEVNYCPAYLMQNLANMASTTGPLTGHDVRGKYASAKAAFVTCFINGMVHPHQQVTYYLMAHNRLEPLQ